MNGDYHKMDFLSNFVRSFVLSTAIGFTLFFAVIFLLRFLVRLFELNQEKDAYWVFSYAFVAFLISWTLSFAVLLRN